MTAGHLVERGWRTYAEHVLPKDVHAVQTQETRRAFYAGAAHLFAELFEIGDDAVSEDEGIARLESVRMEIQRFVRDATEGRK